VGKRERGRGRGGRRGREGPGGRERGRGRGGDSRERRPISAGNRPPLAVLKCSRGLGPARRQGCRGRGGDRTAAGGRNPKLVHWRRAGPALHPDRRTAVMISLPTRPCSPPGPLSLPTGEGWGWSCSMSGARLFPSLARSIVPCSQRISGLHSLVCLLILALACFKLLTCCLHNPLVYSLPQSLTLNAARSSSRPSLRYRKCFYSYALPCTLGVHSPDGITGHLKNVKNT